MARLKQNFGSDAVVTSVTFLVTSELAEKLRKKVSASSCADASSYMRNVFFKDKFELRERFQDENAIIIDRAPIKNRAPSSGEPTVMLNVAMTNYQRQILKELAKQNEMSLSAFVREVIVADLNNEDLLDHLKPICRVQRVMYLGDSIEYAPKGTLFTNFSNIRTDPLKLLIEAQMDNVFVESSQSLTYKLESLIHAIADKLNFGGIISISLSDPVYTQGKIKTLAINYAKIRLMYDYVEDLGNVGLVRRIMLFKESKA